MKLNIHIDGKEFVINVGDGDQTFKWMAAAASNRYSALVKESSSLKSRLSVTPNSLEIGRFIVESVHVRSGSKDVQQKEIAHPERRLHELVSDGDHVYIYLVREHQLARDHSVKVSHWASLAFEHTKSLVERRENIAFDNIVSLFQDEDMTNKRSFDLSVALNLLPYSPDELVDMFESDWENMTTGLLTHQITSKDRLEKLRDSVRASYPAFVFIWLIATAFKNVEDLSKPEAESIFLAMKRASNSPVASTGRLTALLPEFTQMRRLIDNRSLWLKIVDSSTTITQSELEMVLILMRIANGTEAERISSELVRRCVQIAAPSEEQLRQNRMATVGGFGQSNVGRRRSNVDKTNTTKIIPRFPRAVFMQMLVHLSQIKISNGIVQPDRVLGDFYVLISQHLLPSIQSILCSDNWLVALSPSQLSTIRPFLQILNRVFVHFSNSSTSSLVTNKKLLSYEQFEELIRACDIFSANLSDVDDLNSVSALQTIRTSNAGTLNEDGEIDISTVTPRSTLGSPQNHRLGFSSRSSIGSVNMRSSRKQSLRRGRLPPGKISVKTKMVDNSGKPVTNNVGISGAEDITINTLTPAQISIVRNCFDACVPGRLFDDEKGLSFPDFLCTFSYFAHNMWAVSEAPVPLLDRTMALLTCLSKSKVQMQLATFEAQEKAEVVRRVEESEQKSKE